MTRVAAQKVREDFSRILQRVKKEHERILVQQSGKSVAAVIPIKDLRLLEKLEERLDVEAAREALKEPGTISHRELKAKLGL